MTKLSVNINKVATLRNARGGNNPDVVQVALASRCIPVPMSATSVTKTCMT